MKKILFLSLVFLFAFSTLGICDNKKKDKERDRKNKLDALKEMAYKPKDIKLLRFTTFKCDDGHFTGDYGSGTCLQVLQSSEGEISTCGKRLHYSSQKKRSQWKRNRLIVRGQVSEKLPEGMRIEIALRYFLPSEDIFMGKEVKVSGKGKRGWRNFEVTFSFPKKTTLEFPGKKGKIRRERIKTELLDGEYWVQARFVKSKQPRYIRNKIAELEREIPDYTCGDCGKTFMQPTFVKCPNCRKKLTKPVRLYPKIEYKDGKEIMVGKIRMAFVCHNRRRRCNEEIVLEDIKKCKFCGSENLIPSKKDRQMYLEGLANTIASRPDYDPSSSSATKSFTKVNDRVLSLFQKHYVELIKKALKLNSQLKKNYASAYKSAYTKNGKFDKTAWKQWLFSSMYSRVKPNSGRGNRMFRTLSSNGKFSGAQGFKKETWNAYIQDSFVPAMQELINKHYRFKHKFVAMPYGHSYTHLSRLLLAVLRNGVVEYTGSLYSVNRISDQVQMPISVINVSVRPGPGFLNTLFRKIDKELNIKSKL